MMQPHAERDAEVLGVLEGLTVPIWRCEPGGDCDFVNHAWRALTGCEPFDETGRGWLAALHPEDRDRFVRALQHAAAARRPFRRVVRVRTPDGHYRPAVASAKPSGDRASGRLQYYGVLSLSSGETSAEEALLGVNRHLDRTERTLRAVTEQYRTIVETSPAAIVLLTLDGRPVLWNPAAARKFGLESGSALLPCMPQLQEAFSRACAGQQVGGLPLRLPQADGSARELLIDLRACGDVQGRPEVVLLSAQDLTPLHRSLTQTIQAIARMIEIRDPYTAGHERRVSELAVALGHELGLADDRLEALRLASMVHDLGKLLVPAEILAKPTRLSQAEFTLIKQHAQAGYDILKDIDFPWPVADMVWQHHERLDGSGYPRGLTGDEILLEARIIAVADVVEAMASHRPYRAALGMAPALSEIRRGRGVHFDPAVADACEALFARGYEIRP